MTTRDYAENGVPVIRGNNLSGDCQFVDDGFVFVSPEKAESLRVNAAFPGDLIFTQRGTLGQVGLIPKTARFPQYVISQSQMKLAVDPYTFDSRFVYYYFRSPSMIQTVVNHAITSGVPHINLGILKDLTIEAPTLAEQTRIADCLSTYDDLVANNRRRMVLLEDAARHLYQEWFVRLRFPGREHTPVVDGVPDGWRRVRVPEAIDVNPSTRLSDSHEHWWVEMANLPTDSMVIQRAVTREGRSGSKFQNGDTLMARITPCLENGKTAFVNFMTEGEVGRGSTEFIVLRGKLVTPEYVYCLARTYDFRGNAIKSMVGASGRQRVQDACFDAFPVLVPPAPLQKLFTDFARPVFEQIKVLHGQNHRLRAARDLLLPRLMSGEIQV